MFITKMSLPRRTFLRGMGVTLALPLLESMVPALTATAKTAANPQRRFGAIFVPLGERPGYWTPKTVGAELRVHADSEAARAVPRSRDDRLRAVRPARRPRHHRGRMAERRHPEADDRRRRAQRHHDRPGHREADRQRHGVSVARAGDRRLHRLHRRLRHAVRLRLHEHAVVGERRRRRCRWRSIRASTFERMFGRAGTSAQRLARMQTDKSILDSVRDDVKDLQGGLGAEGPSRGSSDYLENVREIEARIQKAEKQATTTVTVPDAPIGVPESFEEHVGAAVRPARAGLRGERHERVHLHDEPRRQPARVPEHRHHRAASLDVASRQQPGEDREPREAEHVSHGALRQVREEAERHAGRRRLAARSFADPLRQRHERERHPLAPQHPDGHRRRRRGPA